MMKSCSTMKAVFLECMMNLWREREREGEGEEGAAGGSGAGSAGVGAGLTCKRRWCVKGGVGGV